MLGEYGGVSDRQYGKMGCDANERAMKFLGDFMTESVEVLEKLANQQEPPVRRRELEKIRDAFEDPKSDKEALRGQLAGMVTAFEGRGDVGEWDLEILDRIDQCFEEHFTSEGTAESWVFMPDDDRNLGRYAKYCGEVDRILLTYSDAVPKYARDYFAFYSIWEVQGYAFPMPLGTSKVVSVLAQLLERYQPGVIEVSCLLMKLM